MLLIWFIWMYGDPIQLLLWMASSIFLTIVNDATRATWLFLMKSKSEVRQLFSSFYTMFHTQFGLKIKAVRTDNAKEFDMFDIFSILMELFIYIAMFILHNKILLWRGNISTFFVNWMWIMPFFMVIWMRKFIWLFHKGFIAKGR